MMIERDYAAERLGRIRLRFDEANRTKARMAPTDRHLARQLVTQLDEMMKELGQPDPALKYLALGRYAAPSFKN